MAVQNSYGQKDDLPNDLINILKSSSKNYNLVLLERLLIYIENRDSKVFKYAYELGRNTKDESTKAR